MDHQNSRPVTLSVDLRLLDYSQRFSCSLLKPISRSFGFVFLNHTFSFRKPEIISFIMLGNIMLTRLERLYIFYIKEHEILIFPLICNCLYLITLFYLLLHTQDQDSLLVKRRNDNHSPGYSCEVCGFENTQLIENLHNEFLRRITSIKKSTPIYMLHAELGRRPVEINIKSRIIGFWLSLVIEKKLNCLRHIQKDVIWFKCRNV